MSLKTAAMLAGIDEDTLHRWRAKDPEFYGRVDIARAECRVSLVERMREIATDGQHEKQLDAIKFWVARRCPEFQDRKEHLEAAGAGEIAAQIAAMRLMMARSIPEPVGSDGRNGVNS